jgi:hypothetical protein
LGFLTKLHDEERTNDSKKVSNQVEPDIALLRENQELRNYLTERYCDERFDKAMVEIQEMRLEMRLGFSELRMEMQNVE